MQLAIALAAIFIGADLAIAGLTKRSFTRLLAGNWDQVGVTPPAASPPTSTAKPPGNAATGGSYAPGDPTHGFSTTIPYTRTPA